MQPLTIAIIGAGSSYTPEIIERLAALQDTLPVAKLVMMDIDARRLETVAGFCQRYRDQLGARFAIETTTERRRAIEGAQFIITQLRVGGNAQRVQDEKLPLRHGVIGQETTGPGGMFKALRTIPAMLAIARDVEQVNPQAWIVNYANPTGLNTEAVQKYTRAKFVGLCSGGYFPRDAVAKALDVPKAHVFYNYYGLNHLNFAYNLAVAGRPLSDAEFDRVAERLYGGHAIDPALTKLLRLLPSPYLQYFFHRQRAVAEAQAKPQTRGEVVQALEGEVFAAFADPNQHGKPAALDKRGGGGYSEIALGVIEAIANDHPQVLIVNTANAGSVPLLPDDAALELPALVNAAGIHPLAQPEIPRPVWGLVAAVKNYESLAVEAAVSGDRNVALQALLAHPLVGDFELARTLLDEMLAANRAFLPQFFPDG